MYETYTYIHDHFDVRGTIGGIHESRDEGYIIERILIQGTTSYGVTLCKEYYTEQGIWEFFANNEGYFNVYMYYKKTAKEERAEIIEACCDIRKALKNASYDELTILFNQCVELIPRIRKFCGDILKKDDYNITNEERAVHGIYGLGLLSRK